MKLLVVGSKGFIGSNALYYFRGKGYDAYGCDVNIDYVDKKYFVSDVASPKFDEPFKKLKFDVCINCSGAASVPDSLNNPARDFLLNTSNVFYILNSIKEFAPNCKFINLSSAAVYGNPNYLPIDESHEIKPASPYGYHKYLAENICKEFYLFYSLKTCSLRVFSAYGPYLQKQIFWDLLNKSINKDKIFLFGTGNETRDFIYIKDLLQIMELIIEKGIFGGECINVANGKEIEIKQAAGLFLKLLNWKGQLYFNGEERKGDPINWKADISIIKNMGYKSNFSLTEGLKEYIEWLGNK